MMLVSYSSLDMLFVYTVIDLYVRDSSVLLA